MTINIKNINGEFNMEITNSIKYVGVNDHKLDLFEGQYDVPNGMAYNSYAIIDEKIAILDSVEISFLDEWLANIKAVLGDRSPDYLVVQHMEPDHSANILNFAKVYPDARIVASARAFQMMKNFFGTDFPNKRIVVADGDSLNLGSRSLKFISAAMVHWPEVIMTYDSADKALFSADAFGKFGALDVEEEWDCEARRYYFGIVGKYGVSVQDVLKKTEGMDIRRICPLHGPVLSDDLDHYIELYKTWSAYEPENEGVTIAYTSVYGNTKKAVELLAEKLEERGCVVSVHDLARDDVAEAVEDAFRYSKLVLATTTYCGDIFPFMRCFIEKLRERNYQNRTIAFIENGSWVPVAEKIMRSLLEKSKNLSYAANNIKIMSALSDENREKIEALALELSRCAGDACAVKAAGDAKYRCGICGWEYDEQLGDPDNGIAPGTKFEDLPADYSCPLCRAGKENFTKA